MPKTGNARVPVEERVWDYIQPEPNSGCWLWNGALNNQGYGVISIARHARWSSMLAHRIVYEMHKGPIPSGLQIDHLCKVPQCVNPDHLEAVTASINVRRSGAAAATKARHKAKTHCKHDHLLSGDNLYLTSQGKRMCRICLREANRRWRRRHA